MKFLNLPIVVRKLFSPKKTKHLLLGEQGEKLARRLVKNLEMKILCRNFSGSTGEIDIVARDGATICFIEVKTRTISDRSRPIDSITTAKKRKVTRTAKYYLRKIGNPNVAYRFDVIEIVFQNNKMIEARYWPNEFTSSASESDFF